MRSVPWSRPRRFRNPLGAIVTLLAIAALAVLVGLLQPPAPRLEGAARAVDGDTLRLGDARIRLTGLDAVELEQHCTDRAGAGWACGKAARDFLASAVGEGKTLCRSEGRDRYGRTLARCSVGGDDLGDAIVRAGWATADLDYGLALAEARLKGRGIWAGSFDDPAEWRQRHGGESFDFWGWLRGWFAP
ncbi:MAG: thermonuclease family protein [Hyphomicrobiales bacterium]|nr:MAG: thermonuclease family protein [Hyphomicrobiales bacterium]